MIGPFKKSASGVRWDRLGVGASALCAVHCLAAPLLFLLVPTFASIWSHPASHALMALIVLPVAATTLLRGYREHRQKWVVAAAVVGCAAIIVGCVLPYSSIAEAAPRASQNAATTSGESKDDGEASGGECCPHVEVVDGETQMKFPPATIATLIGSGFLILGHGGALVARSRRSPARTSGADVL